MPNTISSNRFSGFTLLEIIIYVGLLSILLVTAWAAVFNLMSGMQANGTELKRQEDIEFAIAKIRYLGMGADVITATNTSITFVKDDLGPASPVVITISGGKMLMARNNAPSAELLPSHTVAPTENVPAFQMDLARSSLLLNFAVDNKNIRRKIFFP